MLYRLLAVTAAGMYAVAALHAPGDVQPLGAATASTAELEKDSPGAPEAAAIEVGRSAFAALGFTLSGLPQAAAEGPSEKEAIRIALERGRAIKAEREANAQGVVLASVSTLSGGAVSTPSAKSEVAADGAGQEALWTVTGSTVNLRSGPGTGYPVVGQVSAGDTALPMSDTASDWIRIDAGGASGETWIFAKFLKPVEG